MSGVSPVVTEVHARQLRLSIEALSPTSVPSELTLWLLTVGALEATASPDSCFFYSYLLLLFQGFGIHSVLCWRQRLKCLIWSGAGFDHNLETLWSLLQG